MYLVYQLVYLPFIFQNGQMFNFMLDPLLAVVVATIATPLVTSLIFITASVTIGVRRFGPTSAVVALFRQMGY
jgi:hypothetical protein